MGKSRGNLHDLGLVGPFSLAQIASFSAEVTWCFNEYGLIGANCQHFALEFLRSLGVDEQRLVAFKPDDERWFGTMPGTRRLYKRVRKRHRRPRGHSFPGLSGLSPYSDVSSGTLSPCMDDVKLLRTDTDDASDTTPRCAADADVSLASDGFM